MIQGGCLCGGVRFEIAKAIGPFELCHCNRCRTASGTAFIAGLGVDPRDFRLLQGRELIERYEAPILERPPAYTSTFCKRCGSTVDRLVGCSASCRLRGASERASPPTRGSSGAT